MSRDTYDHILNILGQYPYFWLRYKGELCLGDHGHVRSWIGEVMFDKERLGFKKYLKGPPLSYPYLFWLSYKSVLYLIGPG